MAQPKEQSPGQRPEQAQQQPAEQPVAEKQPKQRKFFRNNVGRWIAAALVGTIIGLAAWEAGRGGQDLPFGRPVPAAAGEVAPTATPTATVRAKELVKLVVPKVPEAKPVSQDWLKNPHDVAGGIPYDGKVWNGDVAPDEIEVFTGGPMRVTVVDREGRTVAREFPGGETRGTIILFVGDGGRVNPIKVEGVIPGANWHGSYRPIENPLNSWRQLLDDRVAAMRVPPNCISGRGCDSVDFAVVNTATGRLIAEGTR